MRGSTRSGARDLADLHGHVRRRLLADPDTGRQGLVALAREAAPLAPGAGVEDAVDQLEADLWGLGPLEPLVGDPTITEVMANGGGVVWVERQGRLEQTDVRLDEATVLRLIERIVAPLGRHLDRASPIVDARLPDGSRVHAVVPPLAVDGPCLTIRRFATRRIALDEACEPGVAALLRWAVRARANVVVCGGAGSGKTTLLNALAGEVSAGERLVTVEDPAELRLEHPHVVRLEARPGNAEGVGAVTVRDLVRTALRMRPDRIVVGEVRGGEALDMLAAMGTGHDGSLSTCHANGPVDALARLETLALMGGVGLPLAAVRQQLAAAVDLVVQLHRAADGRRSVVAVHEVAGAAATVPLAVGGRLVALPARDPRASVEAPDPRWLS